MFIASGYACLRRPFRFGLEGLGLVAAIVVEERRRETHLTQYIYSLQKKRLTKMLNQHLWIDIFKNKIWAFESPDSDTRFGNYGTSKFTYLYTNFNPRKTVKWPDLGNGLGCWLLLARGSMAALGPALACSAGPGPLGLGQHEATVFFSEPFFDLWVAVVGNIAHFVGAKPAGLLFFLF